MPNMQDHEFMYVGYIYIVVYVCVGGHAHQYVPVMMLSCSLHELLNEKHFMLFA